MKLDDVLKQIEPVVGLTSMLAAPESVRLPPDSTRITLGGAYEALAHVQDMQKNCGSDAAYWGWEGQRAYWQTVVHLMEAAKIVGEDNLPDMEVPDQSRCVVMDAAYHMEQFGKNVLAAAQAA